MPMRNDLELLRLEAEVRQLTAYVAPRELLRAWFTLVSISLAFAAAVFVLAGWIEGQVSVAKLFWMTVLAVPIAYVVTWEFQWGGQPRTIGEIARQLVRRALPVPDDLDEARTRLVLCKARIEDLKRSRR